MKTEHKILIVALLLGLLFWVVDAVMDCIFFYSMSFWDSLIFDVPPHEIYIRSLGSIFILGTTLVISKNLAKRRQTEEALQESEKKYHTLAEASPVGIFHTDAQGNCLYVNERWIEIAGLTSDQARGEGWTQAIYAEDRDRVFKEWYLTAGQGLPFKSEYRFQRPDGLITWVYGLALADTSTSGEVKGYVGTVTDITESKQVQEKLLTYQEQLRSLASELLLIEERQRRIFAADLHDSIGQALSLSKLKLDKLRNIYSSADFTGDLQEITAVIGQAIEQTQSLIFELSPPILYELGLEPALEYLLERMQSVHGLATEFEDDNRHKPLNEDLSVLLFRATQELLINIVKHAQAQHAQLSIRRDGDNLRISIEDDGVGFDPSEIYFKSDGEVRFGLFSIRERLRHLGGYLEIVSKPGHGSQSTLVAPLQHDSGTTKEKVL